VNISTIISAKTLKNPTNKTEEILNAAMENFRNLKKKGLRWKNMRTELKR